MGDYNFTWDATTGNYTLPIGAPTSVPNAPTNLVAVPISDTTIKLTWTASSTIGATYLVYRSRSRDFVPGTDTLIGSGVCVPRLEDSGLVASTIYYYYVVAIVDIFGSPLSGLSNEAWAQTAAPLPALNPATSLTATAISTSEIDLSWTASSDSASIYNLYRSTSSVFTPGPSYLIESSISGTTWHDTYELNSGTEYYYYVVAEYNGTSSVPSNEASAATQISPATSLTATSVSTSEIDLSWTASASPGCVYAVYGSTSSSFTVGPSYLLGSNINGTTFSNTTLSPGVEYYYYVVASNGTSTATVSNQAHATTFTAPATSLTATDISASEIDLSWTASATSGVTYSVYRYTSSVFTPGPSNLLVSGLSGTTYHNTGCTSATPYFYYVVAILSGSASDKSNEAAATTLPLPASSLVATGISTSEIDLSWTASSSSGATYSVYRFTSTGFTPGPSYLVASGISATAYNDVSIPASGTRYYYRVIAVCNSVLSTATNEANAATLVAPPTSLAATSTSTSELDLSWTASTSPGVTYTLYRSTSSGFTPGSGNQIASGVSGISYNDTSSLVSGTMYYYYARAVSGVGTSSNSNKANAPTLVLPPTALTATPISTSEIDLSWTASASPGVTYTVYGSTSSTLGTSNTIASGISGTTYHNTQLGSSTRYYYVVVAVNSTGASIYSNEVNAITSYDSNQLVTWTVQYWLGGPMYCTVNGPNTISCSDYIYDFNSQEGYVAVGTPYAVPENIWNSCSAGFTGNDYAVTYHPGPCVPGVQDATPTYSLVKLPGPPQSLVATAVSHTQINLTWSWGTYGGPYTLYRSTISNFTPGPGNILVSGVLWPPSYNDTTCVANTTYYYYGIAVVNGYSSLLSNRANATTPA